MKISVIIPAFNEEQYLPKTLEAVLRQEYPDFEVIVVDNASTDGTARVASAFPVKVVREDRKGTQWAMECGRAHAKGDIIARLDADCLPGIDWLKTGAGLFHNPRVVAASGPYDYYDASSPTFRRISLWAQQYIYTFANFFIQGLGLGAVIIGGNSFMRASALQSIDGFNTDIVFYGDDTDLAKRISRVGRVVFTKKITLQTSARRLASQGIVHIVSLYIMNFFKVIFS